MKKHIVTFLFLIIAIVFYSLGAAGPGTVFLIVGAAAEGTFWFRIFRKGQK
jgi:hypothetical protein